MAYTQYKNVVIVDEKGKIKYFSENNLSMYDLCFDNIMGTEVTSLYKNLDKDNSSMMAALKTGNSYVNLEQDLKTQKNRVVSQVGSTYPLIEEGKVVGSIEYGVIVNSIPKKLGSISENKNQHRENGTYFTLDDIITRNTKMLEVKEKIKKSSRMDSSVLIYGKTGTGKELVAQSIHNCSNRKDKPFISQNCGAIPENLFEGLLFGTVKGSFTGAEDKMGIFEQANGGTIFLDEINSLSQFAQVKLLSAIEQKRIRRIGGDKDIPLDIRVIAALNEEPHKLIEEERLRSDLYYRLSVVQIDIPDLSLRRDDIEIISNYYIEKYNQMLGTKVKPISSDLLEIFKNYRWEGNVRELKNIIEGAFNNILSDRITIEDIPSRIIENKIQSHSSVLEDTESSLKSYLENQEKNIIIEVYKKNNYNLKESAKSLRMSSQLLRYKLDKYGIFK